MKKGLLAESKPMRLPRSSFGRDQGWSRAIAVEPGPKLGPSSDQKEEEVPRQKGLLAESNSCACLAALFGRDRDWSRAIAVEPGPKLGPSSDQEEEERSQFEEEESTSRKDLRLRVILVRLP